MAFALLVTTSAGAGTWVKASRKGAKPIYMKAQVPTVPSTVPFFKLANSSAPVEFMNEQLAKVGHPPLTKLATHFHSKQGEITHGFIDQRSNDAHMIPDIARLIKTSETHAALPESQAILIGLSKFRDVRLIPKDVTELKLAPSIQVMGGAAPNGKVGAIAVGQQPPKVRFTLLPAVRSVSGIPIYGPGSRAVLTLGNDGAVEGFLRSWKTASKGGTVQHKQGAADVQMAIERQLTPFEGGNTEITVDTIKQSYYDGNKNFLSPAFYFTAVLHSTNPKVADTRVHGFVPIGTAPEEIPPIRTMAGKQPSQPPKLPAVRPGLTPTEIKVHGIAGAQAGISVGVFINRDAGMIGMGWDFWSGLSIKLPFISPSTPFNLTEYWWAYPWQVNGSHSRWGMNNVNVAYTQPHGNWYLNTTLSNNQDVWTIQSINPGFGAATGGKLAWWIVDSCEVCPAMMDLQITTGNGQHAFDPWWNVFKGLHGVIGFRTEMWLFDGMNWGYGFALSLGADVNTAWFQAIASDPSYNDGYTYLDGNINQNVHMGRASTFIDARDLGQSIYHVEGQSPAGTLWNFWMGN